MAGLQRSSETFRRSGSSGLVWEDKDFSGEIKPAAVERSRSVGNAQAHGGYRAAALVQPALDPPSPRVNVCGFCTIFGGGKGKGNRRDGGSNKPKGRRR